MKQITLSIKQMKHLESLGLDISDASMGWYDNSLTALSLEEYLKLYDTNEYGSYCPAYTLQDILEKLPEFAHLGPFNGEYRCVCHITHSVASKCGNTMLEASYQMLLWCIENNYIKTNKV